MTALGQRVLVYLLAIAALAATGCLLLDAQRPAAIVVLLLIVSLHAIVMLVEFSAMRLINRRAGLALPTPSQTMRAWAQEVVAAPRVFCWRQPFKSMAWPDTPAGERSTRRGVVLVHGFACNRGVWNEWLARLTAIRVPFAAVNLEPPWASIDRYVASIEQAVRRIEQMTGRAPVIVAHSMGGLAARRWWAAAGNAERVHHLITLGTPHQGTWMARWGMGANVRQMSLRSAWLDRLSSCEGSDRASRITCFYSLCDNIVMPATSATLPGADNRCLVDAPHLHMVDHLAPWAELQRRLGREEPPEAHVDRVS